MNILRLADQVRGCWYWDVDKLVKKYKMECSSRGLGHRPFKAKITGSNPVHSTKHSKK